MVVNVPAATKLLQNGDSVTLDGAGGWVRVEKPQVPAPHELE